MHSPHLSLVLKVLRIQQRLLPCQRMLSTPVADLEPVVSEDSAIVLNSAVPALNDQAGRGGKKTGDPWNLPRRRLFGTCTGSATWVTPGWRP